MGLSCLFWTLMLEKSEDLRRRRGKHKAVFFGLLYDKDHFETGQLGYILSFRFTVLMPLSP
jgi:hypothetical protein